MKGTYKRHWSWLWASWKALGKIRHQEGWLEAVAVLWRMGLLVVRTTWADYVGRDLYVRRLLWCRRCMVFDKRHWTCGFPLAPHGTDAAQVGCWCYMPFKAHFKIADCWLDIATQGEQGWPRTMYFESGQARSKPDADNDTVHAHSERKPGKPGDRESDAGDGADGIRADNA